MRTTPPTRAATAATGVLLVEAVVDGDGRADAADCGPTVRMWVRGVCPLPGVACASATSAGVAVATGVTASAAGAETGAGSSAAGGGVAVATGVGALDS